MTEINREPEFETAVNEIKPIALNYLENLQETFEKWGWESSEIKEVMAGEWDMKVDTKGQKEWNNSSEFYVRFEVVDSVDYEGRFEGYNIDMTVLSIGGLVIARFSPYNFTEKCWTESMEELKKRAKNIPTITEDVFE